MSAARKALAPDPQVLWLPAAALALVRSGELTSQSVLPLCGLDMIDVVVTDSNAPHDLVVGLRERGVEVVVAPHPHENGAGEM